jgi:hypothetical protein
LQSPQGGQALEATPRLAFLTIQSEGTAFIGALLVTNHWGRPLEFHITQPVQPTKLQQILFGPTLPAYLYCDVISKALLEKIETPIHLVITDFPEGVHCAAYSVAPAVCVSSNFESVQLPDMLLLLENSDYRIYAAKTSQDVLAQAQRLLEQLKGLDLLEPFDRLREAIRESRRLGVISRAA